ncbi:MAG TPA: hypothetical protein DDW92_00850 [Candidatus Veblenbacteria bacterium]|uniref:Uncharacterized protein n=5 Tax=Candidatus Vebleniibacteriota TaxID=1817921 RepID=A0A1G2Q4M6_9BACT|nr:MAG: hypothetical protein UV47_C0036G0004 [Parcubacteria group bacterium GW2011_GWA2_42_80]KKS78970.1 MAG: hypothetical protein UV52_C0021G0008 [Parcubacteria group bacterium GW2011_GWD1_42_9]KKS93122.1 MAG: hypothetical protein UV69_C0013G0010 [Parcubacteria group bacterium GW2011_GWE2_43_12]KKT12862.1 MAG: hypothetical protein UV92_C0023G0004 [Parcubacteria group bacterium GW2011_GWA1_43_27]KKT14424.1 MAG: hypothetical protein UV96_C0030G0006 [Parcubacteria group bacterium GW2011_GWF2_43_3
MPKLATTKVDGVARCARYAFGPNRLHLCGPDANSEVLAYLKAGVTDPGLESLLRKFGTLYPYLLHIARANNIADPFDARVVEAYWIGNELLETIPLQVFYRHLVDSLRLKARGPKMQFNTLEAKLPRGARMHHSFHVLNVYERTGHDQSLHTLESIDACRVSWGRIDKIEGGKIIVWRQPLKLEAGKLSLGEEELFTVTRRLEDDFMEGPKVGDIITMHWQVPCEVVTQNNVRWLEKYTRQHLALANQTL